jgi:hypothetical protein
MAMLKRNVIRKTNLALKIYSDQLLTYLPFLPTYPRNIAEWLFFLLWMTFVVGSVQKQLLSNILKVGKNVSVFWSSFFGGLIMLCWFEITEFIQNPDRQHEAQPRDPWGKVIFES